jgi:hypothetical protein
LEIEAERDVPEPWLDAAQGGLSLLESARTTEPSAIMMTDVELPWLSRPGDLARMGTTGFFEGPTSQRSTSKSGVTGDRRLKEIAPLP